MALVISSYRRQPEGVLLGLLGGFFQGRYSWSMDIYDEEERAEKYPTTMAPIRTAM